MNLQERQSLSLKRVGLIHRSEPKKKLQRRRNKVTGDQKKFMQTLGSNTTSLPTAPFFRGKKLSTSTRGT